MSISSETAFPAWAKRGLVHVDAHTDEAWFAEAADETGFEALGPGDRYQVAIGGKGEQGGDEDLSVIVADSVRCRRAGRGADS